MPPETETQVEGWQSGAEGARGRRGRCLVQPHPRQNFVLLPRLFLMLAHVSDNQGHLGPEPACIYCHLPGDVIRPPGSPCQLSACIMPDVLAPWPGRPPASLPSTGCQLWLRAARHSQPPSSLPCSKVLELRPCSSPPPAPPQTLPLTHPS